VQPAGAISKRCHVSTSTPLDLGDFAERLGELTLRSAATAPIADCWQYAEPTGAAKRLSGPCSAEACMEASDFAERLAELTASA